MDERHSTPYLVEVGLDLNFSEIQKATTTYDGLPRISEGKPIKKGMMLELRKNSSNLAHPQFYELVKSIVPLSLLPVFENITKNAFKSKIQLLEKQNAKERKTVKTYNDFLQTEFKFLPEKIRESPRKRALKQELHQAKKAKDYAENKLAEVVEQKNEEVQEARQSLETEEEELARLEAENAAITEKFAALEKEKGHLLQKIRGIKSGIARRTRKSEPLISPPLSPVNKQSKSTMTKIEGAKNCDIILIDDTLGNSSYSGRRYFGGSDKTQTTSGHTNLYFEVPTKHKLCSQVSKIEVRRRAQFIDDVTCAVAGSAVEERQLLYTELIKSHREEFKEPMKAAGFDLLEKLTPEQTVNIQTLLRLPTNKVRNLRICLSNLNINVLASERKMRRVKAPLVSHIAGSKVETGFMGLTKSRTDDDVTPCAFVRVKELKSYIEEIISRDTAGFSDDEHFKGKWWLMFAGDKGGKHMKFHVEVINSLKAGSVDNVHIYCMFEATDSVENMSKVWRPYYRQMQEMQAEGFTILGKEVVIFLGGDYHFLDDNMGHQGSSATYPSSTDKVMLSHLQNHYAEPHTPDTCPVEMRTILDYQENYNENLADDRNNNDLHANGKEHNSVAGPMIFPLRSLDHLVPASMHINLGLVLLVYNLLLDKCKAFDQDEGAEVMESERERLMREWELSSLTLETEEKKLLEHGQNVVVMTNRLHRQEAVIAGDDEKNIKLSDVCDTSRKTKKTRTELEKCASSRCIITKHDTNIDWVCCDTCDKWYHTMCEMLTPLQEITISNNSDEQYKCVECSCDHDGLDQQRITLCQQKIAELINEEEDLNTNIIGAKVQCDDFQAKYRSIVGPRERRLNEALESIKVVRQAYHGNVMVGNHCVTVLKKYLKLTDIIEDQPELREKFDKIFSLLAEIMLLVMARRFLSDEECEELQHLCRDFGEKFPLYFPNRNITRKMHELIFNIPRFVHIWKTIGMLSEQEGESKHATVNAELRSLACVCNHAEKIRLVLEREELRAVSNKNLMKSKPRLCETCKENRVFLRSGRDGVRHCPTCEPECF